VKQDLNNGLKWVSLSKLVDTLFQVLRIIILTRLLDKEAFGILALTMFFLSFTDLFLDMGINAALYHKNDINNKEWSSLFWFNIFFRILIYILLCSITPIIVHIYNVKELYYLIPIAGLNIIFSFGSLFSTYLQKNLFFKNVSLINSLGTILSFILSILMAYNGFGVYSLIVPILFVSLFTSFFFIERAIKHIKIYFHFNTSNILPFIKLGAYDVASRILDFFSRDIDTLLIGKYFGVAELGAYSIIKQIVLRLYGLINPIISQVTIPIFSKLNSDKEKIKSYFLNLLEVTTIINFPLFFFLAISSKSILGLLFGSKYVHSFNIFSFLLLSYSINIIAGLASILIVALGKLKYGFYWTIIRSLMAPITLVIACQFSLNAVVVAQLILSIVYIYPFWYVSVYKIIKVPFGIYLKSISAPLLICALLLVLFNYFNVSTLTKFDYLNVIVNLTIFVPTYLLLLFLFKKEKILYLFNLLINKKQKNESLNI
jgi:O-antigen/teichoic acid export membrane protein